MIILSDQKGEGEEVIVGLKVRRKSRTYMSDANTWRA